MFEDYIINSAVGALLLILGDPQKRSKWRRALLKLFVAIGVAFKGDAMFEAAAKDVGR